jgi:hypothetical protein
LDEQGLLIEQDKKDRQEPVYTGTRRERANQRFMEMWAAAGEASARMSAAEKAAQRAAYMASGQWEADQRAAREAWDEHCLWERQKASPVQARPRTRARGAGRPAGRRVTRQSSGDDDGSDDPEAEADPLGEPLTPTRWWA